MPEISVQHQCAALTGLVPVDSFGTPIGALPGQTDCSFYQEDNLTAGTWECEPGKLQLDLEITEIKAGDSWIFPRGWKGTAEVIETVRKVYMIIS